jgi:hypothetical protein|tara:strand:+ start:1742 stop:1903 length:162 start_codon:yes stop_codon:yes gene_type:complete
MAYVVFVKLIIEIVAICGKKSKIVLINTQKAIAVDKKKWFRLEAFDSFSGRKD